MRPIFYTLFLILATSASAQQSIINDRDPIAGIIPTLELLDGVASDLQAEISTIRSQNDRVSGLINDTLNDIEHVESYEYEKPNFDPELALEFVRAEIPNIAALTRFSPVVNALRSVEFPPVVERLAGSLRRIQVSDSQLFVEIQNRANISENFHRDLKLNLVPNFNSACGFIRANGQIDRDALQDCKADVTLVSAKEVDKADLALHRSILKGLGELQIDLQQTSEELLAETSEIKEQRSNLIRQAQINSRETIPLEMVATIIVTLLVFAMIIFQVSKSIISLATAKDEAEYDRKTKSFPFFLELVTVFVLTVTILILGLANKINNEALAALIGGISGYVLGRINQNVTVSNSGDGGSSST